MSKATDLDKLIGWSMTDTAARRELADYLRGLKAELNTLREEVDTLKARAWGSPWNEGGAK